MPTTTLNPQPGDALTSRQQRCIEVLAEQEARVLYFAARATARNLSPEDFVIVLLAVDCPLVGPVAQQLMPNNGEEWAQLRAEGAEPFARGLVGRAYMTDVLHALGAGQTADILAGISTPGVIPVVCGVDEALLVGVVPLPAGSA